MLYILSDYLDDVHTKAYTKDIRYGLPRNKRKGHTFVRHIVRMFSEVPPLGGRAPSWDMVSTKAVAGSWMLVKQT